jgi:hypothetical protein
MLPSISKADSLAKDKYSADPVPPPGEALVGAINSGEDRGLAVLRVTTGARDYVSVPWLATVPYAQTMFNRIAGERLARDGEVVIEGAELKAMLYGRPLCRLSPLVLDSLSAPTPQVSVAVGHQALRESSPSLRRLASAYLSDICGLRDDEVASRLGYGGKDAEAQGRRDAREGRKLWRQMPAWPWWCLPAGALPDDWQLDDSLVDAWRGWLSSSDGGAEHSVSRLTVPSP